MAVPFADKSFRNIQYVCDDCQRDVGKLNLRAKRVQFLTIGLNGKMIQSRITSWLCVPCMEADPDYTRPARSASPGMRDTKMAKEYDAAQRKEQIHSGSVHGTDLGGRSAVPPCEQADTPAV